MYDEENRLTEERHFEPGSDTPSKTITYDYDQRGLLTAYDDGKTSGSYEHDLRGLRERETIRFGTGASAITKTLERTYRANGQLESLTYPTSGTTTRKVDFAYNGNNQLETLTMPGSAGAIGYRYRWQSVDRVTYPGGVIRQITLDPLQRIERIQVGTQGEPTGILDHRYRYDEVSNIREKDTREGRYDYGYDELDRLTEATPPVALQVNDTNPEGLPVERYRYDRVHNRLESDHQPGTWIYNANNELQSYGTGVERRVLSYDANGSTVKEERGDPAFQVTEYVYDPQDRLIEVKRDGVTQVEYAYDPFGQRIWRETKPASVEGVSVTWFLYSTEGLIGEYRADGSAVREYGWLPNGLWGTDPVWQHDATGTHVMHNDHLFTPERMTRAGESVVSWAGTREAFGRVAVQPGSSTTMLLRFPGQWEDGVGGFYQNWLREYRFEIGLYSQSDRIGIRGGINLFSYVLAKPMISLDYLGLAPGDLFDSPIDAGVDALYFGFATFRDTHDREYCGHVYEENGCYKYNDPTPGIPTSQIPQSDRERGIVGMCSATIVNNRRIPRHAKSVLHYHTHPDKSSASEILRVRHSDWDQQGACGTGNHGSDQNRSVISIVGMKAGERIVFSIYDPRSDPVCQHPEKHLDSNFAEDYIFQPHCPKRCKK